MQPAEKVTPGFMFRLSLLFVLLIAGVIFKTTDLNKKGNSKPMPLSPFSNAAEPGSPDMQQLYNRLVSSESVSAI
ncbi:hypothetical protein MKJ04_16540 [Pontibacter sp. E15-1]|uniref:hypothetical protein n=1 Tax=Pontibacter sp. E15-1 TaxID=2919918 RepID=UPI001F502984|nr:hypothetical protein [Pontibacter sp. E15-1]MCJ8166455.1 hypothetical protein [Pontibacter sp. E15-1]